MGHYKFINNDEGDIRYQDEDIYDGHDNIYNGTTPSSAISSTTTDDI